MLRKDLFVIRHPRYPMGDLESFVIASPETHRPHRRVVAGGAEAEIKLSERKIGHHGFVDLRKGN